MNIRPGLSLVALLLGVHLASPVSAEAPGRKVVLEKAGDGYRWKLTEAAVAKPGARQVLVRVHAVALNRGDLEMLEPGNGGSSGLQVASDAAGEVIAVGSAVTDMRVGDRVTSLYFRNFVDGPPSKEKMAGAHGASVDGVLGDYVILEDTAVAPMPKGLSYEEAATLPTAGLTAWMATVGQRPLRAGDVVLVQGTGGVSVFALQFAAASGARVIATSSSDDKLQRARDLGARDTINYRTVPEWSARVLEITGGRGADVIVDVGGKSSLPQSAKSLAYSGTLSIVGGLTGYGGEIPAMSLLLKSARAQGIYVGSRADYLRMSDFIVTHRLRPVIDKVFELEQFQAALDHMASGNFVGKIVIRLVPPPPR